jgi:hypothetical protein
MIQNECAPQSDLLRRAFIGRGAGKLGNSTSEIELLIKLDKAERVGRKISATKGGYGMICLALSNPKADLPQHQVKQRRKHCAPLKQGALIKAQCGASEMAILLFIQAERI